MVKRVNSNDPANRAAKKAQYKQNRFFYSESVLPGLPFVYSKEYKCNEINQQQIEQGAMQKLIPIRSYPAKRKVCFVSINGENKNGLNN